MRLTTVDSPELMPLRPDSGGCVAARSFAPFALDGDGLGLLLDVSDWSPEISSVASTLGVILGFFSHSFLWSR